MDYFVTTAIPYVNGALHVGNAMDFIMADVLARYERQQGKKVIFSTGTDEHGTKNAEKAAEAGITPKQYVDKMSQQVRDLLQLLNISNDRFIRTTDTAHEQRAQIIWKKLSKDIYKAKYVGLYCSGCEEFVTDTTAKENNGLCPEHNLPYEKIEEENYFFRLSSYGQRIREALESEEFKVVPLTRRNEILSLLKSGLEDVSISRPRQKISWGVPVPGDAKHVMYVWFEALMNYITVLGYPEHDDFKNFWPADVQVIGKGILRFHAGVWPGILLGLDLPLPKLLYVHGYATVDGQKMGKSLNNSVSPQDVVKRYSTDVFRYYFLRHIPSYGDGDFTWDKLEVAYNNELANELGNAVQRTAVMIVKTQKGLVGEIPPAEHDAKQYHEAIALCRFDKALDEVWVQIRGLNQYIDEEKPWMLATGQDGDHLREVLAYQVSCLLEIAELLSPFMPATAAKIEETFKDGIVRSTKDTLFPRKKAEPAQPIDQ